MRWRQERQSENVEDRRGVRVPGGAATVGVGGVGMIVIVLLAALLGFDPTPLLQGTSPAGVDVQPGEMVVTDELGEHMSAVLADTEVTWGKLFEDSGLYYEQPKLVLFSGAVQSACGYAQAAVGPFYCPGDHKVYLDLEFMQELQARFGAPGDFAQAYILAHEVGHHVQTLLGTMQYVNDMRSNQSQQQQNAMLMRLELQADCFAGVWAYHAMRNNLILDQGDLEEGLGAASAVGDDRIQQQQQGYVVPDSFTHGTSAQRVSWFRTGLTTGDPDKCDTFSQ